MFKFLLTAAAMLPLFCASAQQFPIEGRVFDHASGSALPGATVEVEGTSAFSIADDLGRFRISKLRSGPAVLTIRHVGYKTRTDTVPVPNESAISIGLAEDVVLTDEVLVYSTRANDDTPTTFSTVTRQAITKQNFGQDLPYLLNWTPSLVTTSDAGTGFGYTGIRIRGSDATSINVTINGIPYNDAESLGTFWVDIPDIASSSQSIQIQRGVGTSTNGAGAFGATINLQTITRNDKPYATITNSVGILGDGVSDLEYNSRRHTIGFGTGLIDEHWIIDGRFSRIGSEGFIDRATADLSSYYLSAGFYAGNTMIKAMAFGGKERTYQAWYGVPESRLNNDEEAMLITAMNEGWNEQETANLLNSDSRTFNPYTYKDQVDDYQQDHYQLHFSQRLNDAVTANVSVHLTPGKGYYEEFKPDDEFSDYGLSPVEIGDSLVSETDVVRRRWLDNDFYGTTFSLNRTGSLLDLNVGGGLNEYDGKHFGEIIWAGVATVPPGYVYYSSEGRKRDFNVYAKANYRFTDRLSAFGDVQYRLIRYRAEGMDNDGTQINIREQFDFFNPKAGVTYKFGEQQLYASYSVGHREPVRSDFVNAPEGKKPGRERLGNVELGYRVQRPRWILNANYYYMRYRDQLIHTGRLNDVGSPIRTNVERSYRTGLEIETTLQLASRITLNANATVSRNKIQDFTEVLYDYGPNWDEYNVVERKFKNTDISFSPSVVAGAALAFKATDAFEITLLSKYVSRQYLDNTSSHERSLNPYFVNDLRFSYVLRPGFARDITISFLANNFLGEEYESNGYTWGYLAGQEYRENYYYPQAGRNYQLMVAINF